MHLMFNLDENGKRVYTLKKVVDGEMTKSAHPARFSPDDKYSRSVDDVLAVYCYVFLAAAVETVAKMA